jgi:hypothetical protein
VMKHGGGTSLSLKRGGLNVTARFDMDYEQGSIGGRLSELNPTFYALLPLYVEMYSH